MCLVSWQAMADASGPAAQHSIRASLSDEENHCSVGQFVLLISFAQYVRIVILGQTRFSSSPGSCFH